MVDPNDKPMAATGGESPETGSPVALTDEERGEIDTYDLYWEPDYDEAD